MQANEMRLGGRREGVSDWWVFGVLGFWGFGGAPFFLFLFFSEKRGVLGGGDSSFFKFLQLLESLFNIHPTDDPPSKKTSPRTKKRQKKKKKRKNSPKHRPPRPKKQTQTPHLHTRR